MNYTEKRLEDRRMAGKSTAQGMMLLEHIYKGEKYLLFTAVNNTVHIIPDKKLKELIHQAIAEDREIVKGKIEKQFGDFLLKNWSGEEEVYSEIDRLKTDLLSSLDNPKYSEKAEDINPIAGNYSPNR